MFWRVEPGKCQNFSYPLSKVKGEEEDFWHVIDADGKTILTLGFCVDKTK
jgi:hypothetical protein